MEKKMYECLECGEKGNISDLTPKSKSGPMVRCPKCGFWFHVEGLKTPTKRKKKK